MHRAGKQENRQGPHEDNHSMSLALRGLPGSRQRQGAKTDR